MIVNWISYYTFFFYLWMIWLWYPTEFVTFSLCTGPAYISGSSVEGHSAVAGSAFPCRAIADASPHLRPRSLDEFNYRLRSTQTASLNKMTLDPIHAISDTSKCHSAIAESAFLRRTIAIIDRSLIIFASPISRENVDDCASLIV